MPSQHTDISVVIPTYNRAPWLAEALASIAAQSMAPLEVLVIDDGSTDKTEQVCQEASCDVHYFYQDHRGVSAARNRGIAEAKGEWLAFVDSDDLWKPEKLEIQLQYVRAHPEIKIVQTEEVWIRHGKRVNPRKVHQKKSGWIFTGCIPLCIVSPSAVMIHRSVFERVGTFDESFPACEDYDLWLRASLHYQIVTLPQALTIKRGGHEDQLSKQWGLDRYRIRALQKILSDPALTAEQRKLVTRDIKRRCNILIQGYAKHGEQSQLLYYQNIAKLY